MFLLSEGVLITETKPGPSLFSICRSSAFVVLVAFALWIPSPRFAPNRDWTAAKVDPHAAKPSTEDFIPGQLIVKFRHSSSPSALSAFAESHDMKEEGRIEEVGARLMSVPEGRETETIAKLQESKLVEYAEPNYLRYPLFTPNDPFYVIGEQWNLQIINMPAAWNISEGSPSVQVAVIDSGVDDTHPDRPENLGHGWNYVVDGYDAQDIFGHGTFVSGVIAARTNNGKGIASVAPGLKVVMYKEAMPTGMFSSYAIVASIIDAATHGAKVINMSLGGPFASAVEQSAVDFAWGKGVLLVAAAGNCGGPEPGFFCLSSNQLEYPAAYGNVLAVGATTNLDTVAGYSTQNDSVDVSAPGDDIIGLAPGSYALGSGTSFAAPHVSALAGLIWSVNPSLTNKEVGDIILSTAKDPGAAGRNDGYGWGRIDAYRALLAASGGSPTPLPMATATATYSPSPTAAATATSTPRPANTPTATPTPIASPSPTSTPSAAPVYSPTPSPTATVTVFPPLPTSTPVPEVPVNLSNDKGDSMHPVVVSGPDGSAWVIWEDFTYPSGEISARRWDGSSWSEVYNVSDDFADSRAPAAAIDSSGNLHVVWQDKTYGNAQILHRMWDGVSWSVKKNISETHASSEAPAIAADASGNVRVIWKDDTSGIFNLYARSWSAIDGWTQTQYYPSNNPIDQPVIAIDSSGKAHIAWTDTRIGDIVYCRWDGNFWSKAENLSQNSGASERPTIATDSLGRVYVAWDDNSSGNFEILYRVWDGQKWSPSANISQNAGSSAAPALASGSNGLIHLVWHDNSSSSYAVVHRVWNGVNWSPTEKISQTSVTARFPAISIAPDGDYRVAWEENTPGNWDIYYRP